MSANKHSSSFLESDLLPKIRHHKVYDQFTSHTPALPWGKSHRRGKPQDCKVQDDRKLIELMEASGKLMNELRKLCHPEEPDKWDELPDEDEEDGPAESDRVVQNSSESRAWNIIERVG